MAKILLVEDDNNLREIYEARLQAEGYTIASAHDGEEALVVAKAEKPDLIISDVMMPKISGFEMLDILRNTDSLKNVKVIMLTALGQSDDQERANKLGTDRYLVKSQVTLEDIVNVANELLQTGVKPVDVTMPTSAPQSEGGPSTTPTPTEPDAAPPEPSIPATPSEPALPPEPAPAPTPPPASEPDVVPAPDPVAPEPPIDPPSPPPATTIPVSTEPSTPADVTDSSLAEPASEEENTVKSQIDNFSEGNNDTQPEAEQPAVPEPAPAPETSGIEGPAVVSPDDAPSQSAYKIPGSPDQAPTPAAEPSGYTPQPAGKKVIEPLSETEAKPDINQLLEQEKAREIIENEPASSDAPPTMSAADTSPTPTDPMIKPADQPLPLHAQEGVDPNSVAL